MSWLPYYVVCAEPELSPLGLGLALYPTKRPPTPTRYGGPPVYPQKSAYGGPPVYLPTSWTKLLLTPGCGRIHGRIQSLLHIPMRAKHCFLKWVAAIMWRRKPQRYSS
jgi:hypothetical protein